MVWMMDSFERHKNSTNEMTKNEIKRNKNMHSREISKGRIS